MRSCSPVPRRRRFNPLPSKVLYTKKVTLFYWPASSKTGTFLFASKVFLKVNWPKNPINTRKLYGRQKLCQNRRTKVDFKTTRIVLHLLCCLCPNWKPCFFHFKKTFSKMWKSWRGWLNKPPPNFRCVHARKRVEVQTWRRHRASTITKHDCWACW